MKFVIGHTSVVLRCGICAGGCVNFRSKSPLGREIRVGADRTGRLAIWGLVLLGVGLVQSGCASTSPYSDQEASNPVKSVVEKVGFATTAPEPQAFVKATRPATLDYMAVGITPPARSLKPKKADEVKKMEDDLIATRDRNAAIGGVPVTPSTPAAKGKAPAKKPNSDKSKPKTP